MDCAVLYLTCILKYNGYKCYIQLQLCKLVKHIKQHDVYYVFLMIISVFYIAVLNIHFYYMYALCYICCWYCSNYFSVTKMPTCVDHIKKILESFVSWWKQHCPSHSLCVVVFVLICYLLGLRRHMTALLPWKLIWLS